MDKETNKHFRIQTAEYLTLGQLAIWANFSEKELRAFIKDTRNPLPVHRPNGFERKTLVSKEDYREWFAQFRVTQEEVQHRREKVVNELTRGFRR